MRTVTLVAIAVAGFAGGLAGVKLLRPAVEKDLVAETRTNGAERMTGRTPSANDSPRPRNDLASLRPHLRNPGTEDPGLRDEMERLGIPELRSLVDDIVQDLDKPENERRLLDQTLRSAISELVRRQGDAAIQWLATREPARLRQLLLDHALRAAARESPEIAKPWIDRYRADHGAESIKELVSIAVTGATRRGADDLIRLHELFKADLGFSFLKGEYPEGFDFSLLYASLSGKTNLQDVIQHWGSVDKEAAWQAIRKSIDPDKPGSSADLGDLVKGVSAREGDLKAAEWAAARIAELPPGSRNEALRWLGKLGQLSEPAIGAILITLPGESERANFAGGLITPHGNRANDPFVMESLNTRERVAALEIAAGGYSNFVAGRPGHEQTKEIREYFGSMMETWQLSAADREVVTRALTTPKAR